MKPITQWAFKFCLQMRKKRLFFTFHYCVNKHVVITNFCKYLTFVSFCRNFFLTFLSFVEARMMNGTTWESASEMIRPSTWSIRRRKLFSTNRHRHVLRVDGSRRLGSCPSRSWTSRPRRRCRSRARTPARCLTAGEAGVIYGSIK